MRARGILACCLAFLVSAVGEAAGATCLDSTAGIVGTPGPDRLVGTTGRDVIVAGGGRNQIGAWTPRTRSVPGPGADTIHAGKPCVGGVDSHRTGR
jgi:RTX calcium-binding nonapeptide repeat (4 copies)